MNPGEPESRLPEIIISEKIDVMADRGIDALASSQANLFVRAMRPVHVVHDDRHRLRGVKRANGAPIILPLRTANIRELIGKYAYWFHETKKGGLVPRMPPLVVAETIMARGEWPFRILTAVIEAPTLRRDLSVLQWPGYDEASGILLELAADFDFVPESPTKQEAAAALELIAGPLQDFPFSNESDRSAALALILSLAGRHAIDGCVPMFVAMAPTAGTGKTLLLSVSTIMATGREPSTMAACNRDEEVRKRLTAIAIEGVAAVLLDNVGDGGLGSPALAAALTTGTWTDRALGENRNVTVPFTTVMMASGNNIAIKADLARRAIPIYQDAAVERPELRTGFAYPDLRGHVHAQWTEYLVASLTVLRGYATAGLPAHGKPALGSFEQWDRLVRGALLWLGVADPVAGTERVRQEGGDVELDQLRTLLAAWLRVFGDRPVTSAEVIEAARYSEELRVAFDDSGKEKPNARALGYVLRKWSGRIVGGHRLTRGKNTRSEVATWCVQPIGSPKVPVMPVIAGDAIQRSPSEKLEKKTLGRSANGYPASQASPAANGAEQKTKIGLKDLSPAAQRLLGGAR